MVRVLVEPEEHAHVLPLSRHTLPKRLNRNYASGMAGRAELAAFSEFSERLGDPVGELRFERRVDQLDPQASPGRMVAEPGRLPVWADVVYPRHEARLVQRALAGVEILGPE